MQIRPGRRRESFVDRCTKEMNECILTELGDWNAVIAGCNVCVVLEHEHEKSFDQVNNESLTIFWLKEHQPNARYGSTVDYADSRYTIKSGYPVDLHDCWMMAELDHCGHC